MDINWWNVNLGEEAALAAAEAVRARQVSLGRLVEDFEERMASLLGVPHVVAVTSGSSALMAALMEAGIGPGDEVLVPDMTWIATAHAAAVLGAKVTLVDVEPERPLMDTVAAARAISKRSKAILPVHLNGRPCDMRKIRQLADEHGLLIIEDAAQALFAKTPEGEYLGSIGRCGCFSMSVAKLVPAGQGGFITTSDAGVAERLRRIRTQGVVNIMNPTWAMLAGNFRFTGIHAAVAITQLARYKERMEAIENVFSWYGHLLKDDHLVRLERNFVKPHEFPLYVNAFCENRNSLFEFLFQKGIEARPMNPPLHTAAYFGSQAGTFENAVNLGSSMIGLPCGPDIQYEAVKQVVSAIDAWRAAQA